MDVEKTMEFLLAQQARFDAQMAQVTEKLNSFNEKLLLQSEQAAERALEMEERHDREMADLRAYIRHAVRLSTEEQRRERVKRQALNEQITVLASTLDEKITQLAAAQLVTEEKLQKFLDGLGRNGR
jgi:hypothetical protein